MYGELNCPQEYPFASTNIEICFLSRDRRSDGPKANVGPDHLAVHGSLAPLQQLVWSGVKKENSRAAVLGFDIRRDAGGLRAVATVAAGLSGLLGRVAGVQPEHVGVVLCGGPC